MHRIDGPTAAPGGLWTEGNPVGGVPATIVSDDFMNDTQENICKVIEDAGITLVKSDYTQLKAAVTAMITTQISNLGSPRGYFYGFPVANNASLPNTTIDVGVGSARSFDNTVDIKTTATIRGILQSSGSWAAGDNQNKLDTGAKTNNTWYRAFAIRKTSDGTADILFSLSLTSPTLPTGYLGFRYIGPLKTDGSGNIIPFLMAGNGTRKSLYWKTPIVDVNAVNAGVTTPVNYTLSVPPGLRVRAFLNMNGFSGDFAASFRAPDFPGITPSYGNTAYFGGLALGTGAAPDYLAAEVHVLTDTLSRVAVTTLAASTSMSIVTYGWEEEL